MKTAIVLAAGLGKRLRPITSETPKTLVELGNGKCILDYIIGSLTEANYDKLVVVTGFESEKIDNYLTDKKGLEIETVRSDKYDSTNNLYSLWLARDHMEGGFTLVNSDTLFPSKFLDPTPEKSELLIDTEKNLDEEEMKVRTDRDNIESIGKDLEVPDGEYIGVFHLGESHADVLAEILDRFVSEGRTGEWYESALDNLFQEHKIGFREVSGEWVEVDNQNDLEKAEEIASSSLS